VHTANIAKFSLPPNFVVVRYFTVVTFILIDLNAAELFNGCLEHY